MPSPAISRRRRPNRSSQNSSWLRQHPATAVAVVGGGLLVVAGVGFLVMRSRRAVETEVGHGHLVCPAATGHVPASTAGLSAGDFVVLRVASADDSFAEMVWGLVLTIAPDGMSLQVRLAGEHTETGLRPLDTAKHRFRIGQKLLVGSDCVFDVYRPPSFAGQVLCGPALAALDDVEDPDLRPAPEAVAIGRGNRARIVVGSTEAQGTAWHEVLWTTITATSSTGQVLTGVIDEDPELATSHGLRRGSTLHFNRDCVVEVA